MAEVTTVINAIASAYVDSDSPDSNFQGAELQIYRNRPLTRTIHAVLGFNPNALPQGKKVKSIYAQLYFTADASTTHSGNFMINYIDNQITAANIGAITYNTLDYTSNRYYIYDYYTPPLNAYTNMALSSSPFSKVYAITKGVALAISMPNNNGAQTYKLASHSSAHPPRFSVVSEDVAVSVDSASPASGFVNKASPVVFTWGIAYDNTDVIGVLAPATAKFRYRVKGTGSYTEVTAGAASYTLPANTLGDGTYEWQVAVTTNAGTTAISEWMEITTIDAAAIATPISPAYSYEDAQKPITFEWTHNTANGTAQTAANLQYSTDGATWLPLTDVTGASHVAVIPANTFGPGNIFWRVRTHNANSVAGAWSDATMFRAVAPVPVPVFASVQTGTARPKFMWAAQAQAGFDLEIDQSGATIYKSSPVVTTEKAYTISGYLPDGNYTARLRVYSDEGDTSEWAFYAFTVSTVKPSAPTLTGAQIDKGVLLTAGDISEGMTVYILRDGLPVNKGASYRDYATAAEHTYIARAVDANGCYADSAPVTIGPLLRGSFIAPASNLANVVALMLNAGERPTREYTWSPQGTATFYAGRPQPIYEYSDQHTETGNYKRSFISRAEFDGFISVAKRGGTMLYRDRDGTAFWCAVTGLSWAFNRHTYDVSFSLIRIAHKEGIAYD